MKSVNMITNIKYNKLLSHLKSSAKKRNIKFSLTLSDLYELGFPLTCPILDVPINYSSRGYHEYNPSIDRIDSNEGYIASNIQVMSFKANRAKNNLSDKELKQMAKYYI